MERGRELESITDGRPGLARHSWRLWGCRAGFVTEGRPGPAQHLARWATDRPGTLWGLGNFRIWFSGHGFQDLGSQLWGLGNFRIWFAGHGFQDLGSQLWGLDFHTGGFQDRNLKTFRTWFSGCGISILGPGFHTGGFTVAFDHGHPLVGVDLQSLENPGAKPQVSLK